MVNSRIDSDSDDSVTEGSLLVDKSQSEYLRV
jgi:hypothetical protein